MALRGQYQFIGQESAVQAYIVNDVPAWALFMGKEQLLAKYQGDSIEEGADILQQFLNRIELTGVIYTLKVYDLDKGQKIRSNTPCDGSFNFKLINDDQERQSRYPIARQPKPYEETTAYKLDRLIEIMQNRKEEEEEEEEAKNTSLGDRIGAVVTNTIERALNDPEEAMKWVNIFQALTGRPMISAPATIGAVSQTATGGSDTDAIDAERLNKALLALNDADPNLIEHLEKLADMATNNRAMFNVLIGMLDKK